jgi:hypothetical protein
LHREAIGGTHWDAKDGRTYHHYHVEDGKGYQAYHREILGQEDLIYTGRISLVDRSLVLNSR